MPQASRVFRHLCIRQCRLNVIPSLLSVTPCNLADKPGRKQDA